MPKSVLVTGANGQLGSELQALAGEHTALEFTFVERSDLELASTTSIETFFKDKTFDVIINCAAYTAVDKAESDEEMAYTINHKAVETLAHIAKNNDIALIHISTDYVFDGSNFKPYVENDPTNPQSVYGASKLAGEEAILTINPKNSIIIRTSWVYSSYGANFVKTMLRLGKERDELGVIFDQVGTPTYARNLADALLRMLSDECLVLSENVEIYHFSNEGVASWYDFAKEIMIMAKLDCQINPIETKEYPTPASRPHYSLLNKSKIKERFNMTIPYWKDSLEECLRIMGERK